MNCSKVNNQPLTDGGLTLGDREPCSAHAFIVNLENSRGKHSKWKRTGMPLQSAATDCLSIRWKLLLP